MQQPNRLIIFGLSLIIIIAAITYALTKQKSQSPPTSFQPVQKTVAPIQVTTIINITANGFEPKTAQLLKGERVVWINLDQSDHWPAIDPHPSHTDYPERGGCSGSTFDPCQPIKPGEQWAFVFNHSGIWTYHDHLNPSFRGKLIVKDKPNQWQ